MACAVFLILVEAMHLIDTEFEEEVDTIWRWGAAFLVGFLIAPIMFLLNPCRCLKAPASDPNFSSVDRKPSEAKTVLAVVDENKKMTTLFAILVGDFMHNIVDGFAIGFAFKFCDSSLAWSILLVTIYHELPQEVGDFALLTNEVGLSICTALFVNFLAGTSVIVGGVLMTLMDIEDYWSGLILACGGGKVVEFEGGV